MKKKISAALAACMALLLISSCSLGGNGDTNAGSSNEPEEPVDINYPLDFEGVYIEQMPERVVSLSPALTEIICELGYEDRLVGRTDYCDYPASVSALPAVGTPVMLDTDQIAALEPDLIIMQAPPTNDALIGMQQTGAAIVTLPRAYDLASTGELYAKVFTLMEGAQVGVDKGEQYKTAFAGRISALSLAVERAVAAMEDAPDYTGAYIVDTYSIAATPDTYEGKLLAVLGLENAAAEGVNWQFSHEKLIEAKPYILLCASDIDVEDLADNKRLGSLGAVKNDRAYAVNSVIIERQGPRLADELERLAREIYPDLAIDSLVSQPESDEPEQEQSSQDASSQD
ncbi:MAG: ABC transporter substrate-binding protein [Acetanaerobacterium sp.]